MKDHGELADFLDKLLNDKLDSPYAIDDFETFPIAKKPGDEGWILERWRQCIFDIANAKKPPERCWMHPDAHPSIEKLIEILRYVDKESKIRHLGRDYRGEG